MVKIVKYSNRKLYDLEKKGYIRLLDVVNYVKEGQEVEVVDYDQKTDITNEVLTSAAIYTLRRNSKFSKDLAVNFIKNI